MSQLLRLTLKVVLWRTKQIRPGSNEISRASPLQSAADPAHMADLVLYNQTMGKWLAMWPPPHQNGP